MTELINSLGKDGLKSAYLLIQTFALYLTLAIIAILIIGVITFIACLLGVIIGKRFGTKISNKATILGGILLILIGLEICITSFL